MQSHNVELELQKRAMNTASLHALGLSTEPAPCRSSRAVSRPLKILFSYPTQELARDALEFFNGFTVILRGQRITFAASHLTCINQSGEHDTSNLNCSILLTEERSSCTTASVVDQKQSRCPTVQAGNSSIHKIENLLPSCDPQPNITLSTHQPMKQSIEINDIVPKLSKAKTLLTDRLSGLSLSAPPSTKSTDLVQQHATNVIGLAESFCAPDTHTRCHVMVYNIPTDTTSLDIVSICRSQGFFPLEEAPVIFEAQLETNSNRIYTVQRSMTISFSDLATAMLCKDFLNQYVIDQDADIQLFAKLVDKLSEQKVHATGVLVRHIPRIVQQDVFFSAMSSFGSIRSCRFVRGTRTTTGFGAVIFEASDAAAVAKKQGLAKIKEFTLQYIEAKRVATSRQGSLVKSQPCQTESQKLEDSAMSDRLLKNSVSFGAVSYADPTIPPAILASLSNNSDDSTTDVIRAVVEANNRLILSRKKDTKMPGTGSRNPDPQINKLDLLYTAIHNHHLPEEFFKKYETLVRQAGTDDRLLSFLHYNAILHGATKNHQIATVEANPPHSASTVSLHNDAARVNDPISRDTIEIDAKELELDITGEPTATTDL